MSLTALWGLPIERSTCLLNETHTEYLRARGITSKHIMERRGYASDADGLLIPWYSLPDGLRSGHEIRLDHVVDGKKFSRPKGQPTSLNIHPDMLELVRDQTKTLFIVEGTTRADALAEVNIPAVSIPGCYNFMAEKAQLPDWDSLPLMGRNVVIGLDGDVVTNPNVNAAMHRLAALCARKGAKSVNVLVLPNGMGLDDWLAAGNDVFTLRDHMRKHDEIAELKPKRQLPENRARKIIGSINDVKLADDFVKSEHNIVRFDPITDNWIVFDQTRWVVTKSDAIVRGRVTESLMDKAEKLGDDPEAQDLLMSSAKVSSVTLAVKSHPRVVARLDDFDKDGWLINLENGTFDLRSGTLRPHDASILVTQQAKCAYDPNAQAPQFMRFIEWALPNANIRQFVQMLLGQSLVGEVKDHVLPIFTGNGGNGKGTLLGVIRDILGDYAFEAKDDLLIEVKNPSHDEKDALLEKRRFVTCEEPQKGRLHMERVKKLTGGNQITAAFKGKTARTFEPSHTLCVATNNLPDFDGEDSPAIRRRLRIVEFSQTATNEDTELGNKLRSEANGIFLWLLEGLRLYQAEGKLPKPNEIMEASTHALEDADTLAQFLRDTVIVTGNEEDSLISQELYRDYTEWMNREQFGKGTIAANRFGREVKKRLGGWVPNEKTTVSKGQRKTTWYGMKLATDSDTEGATVESRNSKSNPTVVGLTREATVATVESGSGPAGEIFDPNQLSLFGSTELDSTVVLLQDDQNVPLTSEDTCNSSDATVAPNLGMWINQPVSTRSALVTDSDTPSVTDVGVLARAGLLDTYDEEFDKRAPKRVR